MRVGLLPTILVLWLLPLTILVVVETDWARVSRRWARRGHVPFTSDGWPEVARKIVDGDG